MPRVCEFLDTSRFAREKGDARRVGEGEGGRRVAMANFACQWDPSNRVNEKLPEAAGNGILLLPV